MDNRTEIHGLEIPEPVMTLWSVDYKLNTVWFDEEDYYKDYLDSCNKEYEKEQFSSSNSERSLIMRARDFMFPDKVWEEERFRDAPVGTRYDYLEELAGKSDVFRKQIEGAEKSSFVTVSDGFYHFLWYRDEQFTWEPRFKNIDSVYEAFRKHGINFSEGCQSSSTKRRKFQK